MGTRSVGSFKPDPFAELASKAALIKNGVELLGVIGTEPAGMQTAKGITGSIAPNLQANLTVYNGITVTGLTFQPKALILCMTNSSAQIGFGGNGYGYRGIVFSNAPGQSILSISTGSDLNGSTPSGSTGMYISGLSVNASGFSCSVNISTSSWIDGSQSVAWYWTAIG